MRGFTTGQQTQTIQQVRSLLEHLDLADEQPTVAAIANDLLLSRRTLQRRLQAGASSLREEWQHARCVRSHRLLSGSPLNFTEIAQVLGCFDASHFSHSLQKWTGLTPSEYQARILSKTSVLR